jgi:hypothetical protein
MTQNRITLKLKDGLQNENRKNKRNQDPETTEIPTRFAKNYKLVPIT